MPLEQIKPAFSFYDSSHSSSRQAQSTDPSDHQPTKSPAKAPTSLPYYYQSSLRSNKSAAISDHSDSREGCLEYEPDSDQDLGGERSSGPGTQDGNPDGAEEDSAESSPPSPLSPPETNSFNHSGDQTHGIRSIGIGGNSLRQQRQHQTPWDSTTRSTLSNQRGSSSRDGVIVIHGGDEEEDQGEDQDQEDIFKSSRSRRSSGENYQTNSCSSSHSNNWHSNLGSTFNERIENPAEDHSALTKLGGVGGVTRSGSWGRNDSKSFSSDGREELRFQRELLDQEVDLEEDEESGEEESRDSRLRRRESTEGKGSNLGFGRGVKSIGRRGSVPSPSPPASPTDVDSSQLAYLCRSHSETAAPSSTSSDTTSKAPLSAETMANPRIPPYSRTSTTSTNSTRFSHASTSSSYSDSSYSSYASSNPNGAPSALSLRSVTGSIKSNRDKSRNRDSSSSLRSNKSTYSHTGEAMEEQREDSGTEKGSDKQQMEDAHERRSDRDLRKRDASEETTGTEVGDIRETEQALELPEEAETPVNTQQEPGNSAVESLVDTPVAVVSDPNSGFSAGGFKSIGKGSAPSLNLQSSAKEREESAPTSSTQKERTSLPSSPTPSIKKSAHASRRAIAPLTLTASAASTVSNPSNLFSSSGSSTSNSQKLESPSNSHFPSSQFQFEPPVPRRHSGIYLAKTRSALSSRHPTINSRFEHGHGGRAAARERAALEYSHREGTEQKYRNGSGSSSSSSLSASGRAYAASQPASPLILSSSGSNLVSDWQGLTALSSINPALTIPDLGDSQMRTPQASKTPLPSPGNSSFSKPSCFESGSRRGSSSNSASKTPMPTSTQFNSRSPSFSPSPNFGVSESFSSPLSRSLGDRKGGRSLTVLTSQNQDSPSRGAIVGLGLSPTSTPKGLAEGELSETAGSNLSSSKGSYSRPKMQRASTTGHGMGLKLQGGVGQVLRTPTTEEWTRFLAGRGGGAGMSGVDFRQLRLAAAYGNGGFSVSSSNTDNLSGAMSRSRSSSLLPNLASGNTATASSISSSSSASLRALPDPSQNGSENQEEAESQSSDSDSEEGLQIAASMVASGNLATSDPSLNEVGVLERLRRMSAGAVSALGGRSMSRRAATSSRASSSVRGSDLESLNEEDGEDDDEAVDSSSEGELDQDLDLEDLVVGARSRHGSSSSLERMNALYEAISRPQSRVTSPVMSPFSSPGRPSSPISSRIQSEHESLDSHFRSLSSTNLSLETYAKNQSLGVSPSAVSNLSLGSNSNADLNKTNNAPSSPNRYQSPLLINANTRRGSSHSQGSSPNPAGSKASPNFGSASTSTGASLLPPPSNESLLTRESTLRPAPSSGPLSETPHKSTLASRREAANASAAERQVAAHAFGYPLPPPGTSRCINDFVVTAEIGRGAYGLVKKVRIKGVDGNPVGDEFVAKYIIKSRILADCWRRHRVLGPIPIEIHVMDQLRRLAYDPPAVPHPWAPEILSSSSGTPTSSNPPSGTSTPLKPDEERRNLNNSSPTPNPTPDPSSPTHQFHPNICPMVDFFEDHEFYYLIMPVFGRGQDLFDYVESLPDGLSALQVRSIFGQVADALNFLHANSIVHRDIKDENVILNFKAGSEADNSQAIPTAQLIDFGSATHIRPGRLFDTFSGTLDYAAAEILRGEKYSGREQDVWALGVVGYVLLCGECPFWNGEEAVLGLTPNSRAAVALQERCFPPQLSDEDPQDEVSTLRLLADVEGQEDGGGRLSDAADLIARCLELEQEARPTAQQICSHKFLIGSKGWRGPRGWLDKEEERIQSVGDARTSPDSAQPSSS